MIIDNKVILGTAYFPPISYFKAVCIADKVCIEVEENYNKQSFRNRMEILGPNGLQVLSFPIQKSSGLKQKTKDVKISYDTNWQKIHWKSIETAYNSSPYFLYYRDDFAQFFNQKYTYLVDYNTNIFEKCLSLLKIKNHIFYSQSFEKTVDFYDLRAVYQSKKTNFGDYFPHYIQVFSNKFGFVADISILDLLFNLGPQSNDYLSNLELPWKSLS